MCEICHKYKCSSGCPSYEGESAELGRRVCFCEGCGVTLYEYEEICYSYGKPYCIDCLLKEKNISEKKKTEQKVTREDAENYLRGYQLNRKLLRLDRYEKEFFHTDESDVEALGEAPLARARMFEIRHFVMQMKNSEEKLFLYYHYIKGESVERCGELLNVSRSTAFRMKSKALDMAACEIAKRRNK